MLIKELSENNVIFLEKIRFQQLLTLFELLKDLKSRDNNILEPLYRKKSVNYSETIEFLENLELLTRNQDSLVCSDVITSFINFPLNFRNLDESLKVLMVNTIFSNHCNVSTVFFEYISKFEYENEQLVYKPTRKDNLKYSGVRNLLMELDVVKLVIGEGKYILKRDVLGINSQPQNILTINMFEKLQKQKKEIGDKAESIVFEIEKNRFLDFPDLSDQIRHISRFVVNAGYDIESFEDVNDTAFLPPKRFIEVKAINLDFPKFFWSTNEINKAKELERLYWLYLVPYHDNRNFVIDSIERISNPYFELFVNGKDWMPEVELFSFTKFSNLGKNK